ncbi:tellurite resistance TerB family protein [Ohtaekwangia koreensis]|uniref:Tellurite resistance protein TerB n=1 Tax=Ohtaekwangia koreensis TaxID=688867 RepID=A0A1T5M3G5_9BACT|nr:TerB family tellurite resistance protein [Ohtaekwangia koreensis]SKC82760.1 Tellurite resistance protein TerB [Ohtaekwangia koreensis]
MIIHSSFSDFVVFLYVHLSQADNSYDPSELSAIKGKMASLYPDGTDIERKLYTAIREYNSFDSAKLSDLFLQTVKHFGQEQQLQKSNLLDAMQEIIRADGKVDQSETKALEALKQLIEITV